MRCKMAVQSVLQDLGIGYTSIGLGHAELVGELTGEQEMKLGAGLKHYELELMDDKRKILVERIKTLIIEILYSFDMDNRLKLSAYLSERLDYSYTYMSNMFSEMEGYTIERFYIETRIERVKELIVYEKLSITEIAYRLNFSDVSHLCLQFKKVTGQTPSNFRKLCDMPDYAWKTCK